MDLENADNKELIRGLISKTDELLKNRLALLAYQTAYMKAKEEIVRTDNAFMREIANKKDANGPKFKNAEARNAELNARQQTDGDYQKLIETRNESWFQMKKQEAEIMHTHDEIQNIRLVLSL